MGVLPLWRPFLELWENCLLVGRGEFLGGIAPEDISAVVHGPFLHGSGAEDV